MAAAYFDDVGESRQTLLWAIGTRLQLDAWESDVAEIVRRGIHSQQPPGKLVWLGEIHRHLVFVSARNLLRALQLGEVVVDSDLAEQLQVIRDLLEHWDENMPIFNVYPRLQEPPRRSGKRFASRHPGRSPYSQFSWNGKDDPMLTPDVPAWVVHDLLDKVERLAIEKEPSLAEYLQERPSPPWLGESAGPNRWWPSQE